MVRPLNPILAKIAKEELTEDPQRTGADIQHLKDWISKQPHLRARTEDQWLLAMLRGCKFSLEKAKKKIDLYYTLKTTAPDLIFKIRPTEPGFIEFLKRGFCLILPQAKDPVTPRIILLRPGFMEMNRYGIADIMCVLSYLVQILVLEDDAATVVGTKTIVDYEGITIRHAAQLNPGLLKKVMASTQDSFPLRLKGSHHVNVPAGLDAAFTLIRSFLNEKAKDRMRMHKTANDLVDHVPRECLPEEYGGTGGSVLQIADTWVKKMVEYREWMQTEEQLGTDESRRPGAPRSAQEMFGVDGSFRKLDID